MSFTGRYIVVGVDGTGSLGWMRPDGSNSHVWRFVNDMNGQGGHKRYYSGPGARAGGESFGLGSADTVDAAVEFVHQSLFQITEELGGVSVPQIRAMRREQRTAFALENQTVRIVLVGHSRGAAIVIAAAPRLWLPVYFMGLYDSVDRTSDLDASFIHNTYQTYHAIRDPEFGSRSSFGNSVDSGSRTSTPVRVSSGHYHQEYFATAHGGVGGDFAPATGLTADFSCSSDSLRDSIERSVGGSGVAARCADATAAADRYIRNGARRCAITFTS